MDPYGAVVRLAFPYCHIHYTAGILYIQYKINKAADDGGVYPRTRGRKQLDMSQTRVLVIINTWSLQQRGDNTGPLLFFNKNESSVNVIWCIIVYE
jgi:hypothetical protein